MELTPQVSFGVILQSEGCPQNWDNPFAYLGGVGAKKLPIA
jgi:hypothetical protein